MTPTFQVLCKDPNKIGNMEWMVFQVGKDFTQDPVNGEGTLEMVEY